MSSGETEMAPSPIAGTISFDGTVTPILRATAATFSGPKSSVSCA
jgi:hypothetical protein